MGLNKKKTDLLREFVDFTCEECNKGEEEVGRLEPHRIQPGCDGGTYNIRNIKMCCSGCHEIISSAQRITRGLQ